MRPYCRHGHPYSPENTRVTAGRRYCRQCGRERVRVHRLRKDPPVTGAIGAPPRLPKTYKVWQDWMWGKVSSYLILSGYRPLLRDNKEGSEQGWALARDKGFAAACHKYSHPCPSCGSETQPTPQFYYASRGRYNGLQPVCKACSNKK